MTETQHQPASRPTCPRCGAELPVDTPPELCPKCLLRAGLGPRPASGQETVALPAPLAGAPKTVLAQPSPPGTRGLLQPGDQLGSYRVIRSLGGGGMGFVFEAEELESGRRVALKVLSHSLDSPGARERFFREGRLAASINHPNSVYVFGTEEIGGTPVIAMELVSGGTLEDQVRGHGPLAPAEAVDAALQIINGLEAAQAIGILHRDIKPSNCFLDGDGTVKIGDFGLSISTAIRLEPAITATGSFLGTPAFCSPEQLRGEELNSRSDMFSVGATLFYLLTGRTPFEAKNVVALIATMLEQPAPSPRRFRPALPRGLGRVVQRCLEKDRSERFKTYDELRRALTPFSSLAPTPAPLGLRFVAGLVDFVLLSATTTLGLASWLGHPLDYPLRALDLMQRGSWEMAAIVFGALVTSVLYYAVLEGMWGATIGKALCGLRVVGPNRAAPGLGRALGRALLYVLVPALPAWLLYGGSPRTQFHASAAVQYAAGLSFYFTLALMFSSVRRRNGLAASQDLATGTRVILRLAAQTRPGLASAESPGGADETAPRVGPYHLLEKLEADGSTVWWLGYDLRLLRKVWVRLLPPGTPPVPAGRRNLSRVSRLRWLAGQRSAEANWDAFEALPGQALLALARSPQPWNQVRYWLSDLATELGAAQKDGTLPEVLALDRVWITADGRAKLLDFPAPGARPEESEPGAAVPSKPPTVTQSGAGRFLLEIAVASLTGRTRPVGQTADEVRAPLPLHAREFLNGLPEIEGAPEVTAALNPLLQRMAVVTRARRAAIVAGCVALPLAVVAASLFGLTMMKHWDSRARELVELNSLLASRWGLRHFAGNTARPSDNQFAVYIAGHYRSVITNEALWSSAFALAMIKGDARRFAENSVAEHPNPTAAESADAERAVSPRLPRGDIFALAERPSFALAIASATLVIYVALPALIAAVLCRGGLVLRAAGVAFVGKSGQRASRGRVLWRALVVWSPVWVGLILAETTLRRAGDSVPWWIAAAVCGLALVSWAIPGRGLADRLAGTWPVPR